MDTMAANQIKAATRHVFEELNKQNVAVVDEVLARNVVWHQTPADIVGRDAYKKWLNGVFVTFPDIRFNLDDIVAEGNKVAFRYTWTGTFKGNFGNIAPTGKKVTLQVFVFQRYTRGKLIESWSKADNNSVYRQMGVPPPQT
jgi:predicted ester cyclase